MGKLQTEEGAGAICDRCGAEKVEATMEEIEKAGWGLGSNPDSVTLCPGCISEFEGMFESHKAKAARLKPQPGDKRQVFASQEFLDNLYGLGIDPEQLGFEPYEEPKPE